VYEVSEQTKILLVDDDIRLCTMISDYLSEQAYDVTVCHTGIAAIKLIGELNPDLVVLDLMLPGIDGLTVCREVRSSYSGKILMLTALEDTSEEITGLEIGADDYIIKPVKPRLLLARIRTLLRRGASTQDATTEIIKIEALTVDKSNREVSLSGNTIAMTTTEFDLLWLLASNAGDSVTRETLHESIFRLDLTPDDRRIDLLVSRIRKKIGDSSANPHYIKTVRGRGYLMGKGH